MTRLKIKCSIIPNKLREKAIHQLKELGWSTMDLATIFNYGQDRTRKILKSKDPNK